jgi:hypothetical protein
MEKASLLNPSIPIVTDHLGDVYWMNDRKMEAVSSGAGRCLSSRPKRTSADPAQARDRAGRRDGRGRPPPRRSRPPRMATDPTEAAPAKLNLCLHVTGRRADGYHLLDSLVVFADVADRVSAAPG